MSIYSGFATRHLEQTYDHIIYNVIETLLLRIKSFYHLKNIDQFSFIRMLDNQVKHLRKMQERKYLQPKYTPLLEQYLHVFSTFFDGNNYEMDENKVSNKKYRKKTLEKQRSFSILSRQLSQLNKGLNHVQKDSAFKNKTEQKQLDYTRIRKRKFYQRKSGRNSIKKSTAFYRQEDIFEKASQFPSVNSKSVANTIRLRKQSGADFNSLEKNKIKNRFNSQNINYLQSLDKMSKSPSEKGEKGSSEQQPQPQKQFTQKFVEQPKILKKIPKFRSKMYFNNKLS